MFCFLIQLPTDQLNTTVHGVMKTTPYEVNDKSREQDSDDENRDKSRDKNQDSDDENRDKSWDENQDSDDENRDRDKSRDESQDSDDENRDKSRDESQDSDDENQDGDQDENQDKSRDESQDSDDENRDGDQDENQDKSLDGEKRGKSPDKTRCKSPDFLATTEKHRQLREAADKQYRLNVERMKLKYCKAKRKKVLTFSEGDFVSVRIPRIDRTSTDFHRLPCIVVECLGSQFHLYRLRYFTKYID